MSMDDLLPYVAGAVIPLIGALFTYLTHRRGVKADESSHETAAHANVYAGYGGLLERLQEENANIRRDNSGLRLILAEYEQRERSRSGLN